MAIPHSWHQDFDMRSWERGEMGLDVGDGAHVGDLRIFYHETGIFQGVAFPRDEEVGGDAEGFFVVLSERHCGRLRFRGYV